MLSFYLSQHHSEKIDLFQDWIRKAKMIRCSAPLPEGSPDPVLARMLEHAPYQVPSGEDKGRNKEAESGLHTLHIQTGGISVSAKEGEESRIPSPQEGKGPPLKTWKRRFPNEGRNLHQGALPRRASLPHNAHKGASLQLSRK